MASNTARCPQEDSGKGFVIDENGKFHLAPLRLPELMSVPMSSKKSSEKKCIKRKYIPIQPEKFDFAAFELNNSPLLYSKKRKIDKTSVRKELFTAPPRKSIRNSLSKQHLKNPKSKPVKTTTFLSKKCEPLIKIDEEPLQSESFALKPPLTKSILNKTNQPVTPLMDSDEAEELHSEQTFIMNEIKTWIQEEKEDFEIYRKRHQDKLQKLAELLNQFENIAAPVRNNIKKTGRVMTPPSPAHPKKVDLRKIALNNHLKENIEYQRQSPRTKKAVQMYNSIRYDYSVLCTPKLEKTSVDAHQASVRKSLSRKIQKQCLMLQDTPKQKS